MPWNSWRWGVQMQCKMCTYAGIPLCFAVEGISRKGTNEWTLVWKGVALHCRMLTIEKMDEWKWILVNILGFQSDFVCLIRRFSVIKDSAVLFIWLFMCWAGGKRIMYTVQNSSEWLLLYCFCWQHTADNFYWRKFRCKHLINPPDLDTPIAFV